MFDTFFQKSHTINCNGQLIDLSVPKIMGILNCTPDSFYENSRVSNAKELKLRVQKMVDEGADILDVGAYSSRPGAEHISENEEWNRLEPVLNTIRKQHSSVLISVDTFRSGIAQKAVHNFQVDMVNDISGGNMDAKMFDTIARLKVPYIVMHMRGTPQTMQQQTHYQHLMREMVVYFASILERLNALQIPDVLIDPGFGFSKTLEQNFEILCKLDEFRILERPVLVGLSRKSMIYKTLDNSANESLNGTTVLNTMALQKGAAVLRVHDVKEAKETLTLYLKTKQFCQNPVDTYRS
jgi:dihydropteroate synthase